MDLRGMEIFVRVVQEKSFSAAAERLRVSKSVVSKHVRRMETSLGVRLLNRTTRCVSLTEAGTSLYEQCARIVAAAEEAEASARSLHREARGTLRASVPVALGVLHVAGLLPRLLAEHPALALDLTFADGAVHLVDDGLDAAILITDEPAGGWVARKLCSNVRQVCAAPAYFRRCGVPDHPIDLKAHNCLVHTVSGAERDWSFSGPEGEARVVVSGNLRLDNENAIRHAVLAGYGIGLLPRYLVGADLEAGRLHSALTGWQSTDKGIYIAYPSNRHVPAKVRVFVDFLVDHFAPVPPWDRPSSEAEA